MTRKRDRSAEFGRRLRELRVERGISQEALTQLAGLDKNYVQVAEQGTANPTLRTIGKLADALGVEDVDLISDVKRSRDHCDS